jgi:hypothetical protein
MKLKLNKFKANHVNWQNSWQKSFSMSNFCLINSKNQCGNA